MDLNDDNELYRKIKGGDEHAFKALFQKYYSAMCQFADQLLLDSQMAEEIVQDLFVRIWEKRESISIESSVRHYLFKSIRNQCLNQLQHLKIRKKYAGRMMESSQQEVDPEQYFMEAELFKRIDKCIESLPPKRQEIFRLSREKGLRYQEIADELHISIKTVEAQMGLSLKYLRDELKEYGNHNLSLLIIFKKI